MKEYSNIISAAIIGLSIIIATYIYIYGNRYYSVVARDANYQTRGDYISTRDRWTGRVVRFVPRTIEVDTEVTSPR